RLTNNAELDGYPTWSPDGTKIAFISVRGGEYEIYVMNADGSGQTNLTNNPTEDLFPTWQPVPNSLIVVNTLADTIDSNPQVTSLREAILAANSNPGADTIRFAVVGTIDVFTQLPFLSDNTGGTTIDGSTAPGFAGTPVIVLQGPGAGAPMNGL